MNTPKNPTENTVHDVVVIGAGMSGLMAATTLAPSADVVVLESSDRTGGRVETVRRGDYWVNVGTQFTEGSGTLIDARSRTLRSAVLWLSPTTLTSKVSSRAQPAAASRGIEVRPG